LIPNEFSLQAQRNA